MQRGGKAGRGSENEVPFVAAFADRSSRRFDPRSLPERLLVALAGCPPCGLRVTRQADARCQSGPSLKEVRSTQDEARR